MGGALSRNRTCDIHFRRVTFYPLNYQGQVHTLTHQTAAGQQGWTYCARM